jgi:hypothetical protein
MVYGWALILITFLLVGAGCAMYVLGSVGWAQLVWVLASGTAGAGCVLLIEGGKK